MFRNIIRKTVSMTSLFSFAWLVFTGVLLAIMPEGRVAYWADWHILGMNKDNIGQTHINVSILFIIMILLHIWLNWSSIMLYMKNKNKKLIIATPETLVGAFLACVVFFGTLYAVAPFSKVNELISDYKDNYEFTLGNPPYGHAELSTLAELTDRMHIDPVKAAELLKSAGYKYSDDSTIKEIASINKVRPADVYNVIKPARVKPSESSSAQPKKIDMSKYEALQGTGIGRKTIAEVAEQCGIKTEEAIARLKKNGVDAAPDDILKEAAEKAKMMPINVYIIIDTGVKP